jgi:hypothetical protein
MIVIKKIGLAVAMLGWMALAESRSEAEYIAFTIQGTGFVGVGSGGVFQTEQVSIILVGDTDNSGPIPGLGTGISNFSSVEYSVQGQGNFFSTNPGSFQLGNLSTGLDQLELQGSTPPNKAEFSYPSSSSLTTYALNASLAPVAVGNMNLNGGAYLDSLQGGGAILLNSLTSVTFSATTTVSVPEPSAAALFGVAAAMVLGAAGFRRKRAIRSIWK